MTTAHPTRGHLLTLTAICAVAYFLGLTTHGVAAWHEGQRLLVARQMLDAGEWIVPTINGHPYLAKPPLFYWVQMAIASARGSSVTLLDTRLAVALFGWLGVLATYFAARDLLQAPRELDERRGREWTDRAAFWSAAMLATGLDYARSARVGELDMLLPALVAAAVWMVFRAWRSHAERARTDWRACGIAACAAAAAGLTKGPPALGLIAIGAYGGIALHAARTGGALRLGLALPGRRAGVDPVWPARPSAAVTGAGAALGGLGALWLSVPQVADARGAIGAAVGAGMAALVVGAMTGLLGRTRAAGLLGALSRTHPVVVLGVPVVVLWLWVQGVGDRIDPGLVDVWAGEEVDDNLRPLRPESPLGILEAASFGVGLGSAAFFGTLWWLVWRRPAMRPGWWVVLAWSIGGLVVFSLFGKGLARYVLPVWPAMAMLGGIGVAELARLGSTRGRRWLRGILVAGTAVLAVWHAAWYGVGRAVWYGQRTPREFVAGLLAPGLGVDPSRLATFELYDPGIDYYLDALGAPEAARGLRTRPVGYVRTRFNLTGLEPWSVEELREAVVRDGEWVVIVRESGGPGSDPAPALERLARAGFLATVLPLGAEYRLYGGSTRLLAVRVEAR